MTAQRVESSKLGKVARVLMVFLLVFGVTFRTEVAIAASYAVGGLDGHKKGELEDMTVWQLDPQQPSELAAEVNSASETAAEAERAAQTGETEVLPNVTLDLTTGVTELQFVSVPEWAEEVIDDEELETEAVGDEDVIVADFVEWYVDGKKAETGEVFTVDAETFGNSNAITVSCSLNKKAAAYVSDDFEGDFEARFQMTLVEPKPPEPTLDIDAVVTLSGKGIDPETHNLELTRKKGASFEDYQLKADVQVTDMKSGKVILNYSSDEGSLAEKTKSALGEENMLTDLKWELASEGAPLDAALATIDQNGLLKVKEDCSFTILCYTEDTAGAKYPDQVSVTCKTEGGEEPDPGPDQGDKRFAQKTLTVKGTVLLPSGEQKGSSSSSSSSSSSGENEYYEIDEEFTLDDINKLAMTQGTYQMVSGKDGAITITGEGPTLKTLLEEAGITDFRGVNEIKFIDCNDMPTSFTWNELDTASPDPLIAVQSYVHSKSAKSASESSSSSSSEEETMLENTRFRFLVNSGASAGKDADDLRYIKTIEINPGTHIDPPTPEPEAPFSVRINYQPVPIGETAVMNATPSKDLKKQYDLLWEESSDEGKTWKQVSENQELRVKTTKERIGHQFRVTLNSTMINPSTGEKYHAMSDPETLKAADDGSVVFQLRYNPPVAGEPAIFRVVPIGDVDVDTITYVWLYSTDGEESWEKLPEKFQGKAKCQIPTSAEVGGGDDDVDVPMTYIKCKGSYYDKKNNIKDQHYETDTVAFTVHPRDDSGTGEIGSSVSSSSSTGTGDDPTIPGDPEVVYPDDPIDPSDPYEPTEDVVATPTVSPKSQYEPFDMSKVNVDGKVSEKVANQQEHFEEAVPGARWQSLTTKGRNENPLVVLEDNPIAPFAIPTGLGVTVAGGLEKLLAFRRQI